ncbi:MAG: hypothetical protein BWX92_01506 [Deltaproteobacteria bacterium ADurb.Bin135]|jgi:hypothetical protein|nr:MAG: hypothetical protein BWX92_01506 [Deltaproteobacteria bacterium ADurb.Bin135]
MIDNSISVKKENCRDYVFTAEERDRFDACITKIFTENAIKVKLRKEAEARARELANENKKKKDV